MKPKPTTIIYLYTAVLFVLAFLFTARLMKNIRSGEWEYLKLSVNLLLLLYIVAKVIKLGKAVNDKNNNQDGQ